MTSDKLAQWASAEVSALIQAGIDPLDSQNTIKRVLAKLPEGVDPRTWLPPVQGGNVEVSESDIQDARADYYADPDIDNKWRMLLDATETD